MPTHAEGPDRWAQDPSSMRNAPMQVSPAIRNEIDCVMFHLKYGL